MARWTERAPAMADVGDRVAVSLAEVFGRERLQQSLSDEDWLPVVGARGWVVFGRDQNILKREEELRAFLDAKIHMFLLPGQAERSQIVELLSANLHTSARMRQLAAPALRRLRSAGAFEGGRSGKAG